MTKRANHVELAPTAMQMLFEQENYLRKQFRISKTIKLPVWELVKIRVSQLNQCAFCIDMHSNEAINQGESIERIIGLSAWRDMPFYSEVERLALEWAELLSSGKTINDERYNSVKETLGEHTIVDLTIAINAINSWNRIAKVFKPEVGSYKAK